MGPGRSARHLYRFRGEHRPDSFGEGCGEAQSIGYIEYPTGAIYVQDPDQVATYALAADRLCAAALSEADSVSFIERRIVALSTSSEA